MLTTLSLDDPMANNFPIEGTPIAIVQGDRDLICDWVGIITRHANIPIDLQQIGDLAYINCKGSPPQRVVLLREIHMHPREGIRIIQVVNISNDGKYYYLIDND